MDLHDSLPGSRERRSRGARALLLLLAIAMLGGCASTRGIAEFAAYQQAYTAAAETGHAVLDRLAVAERKVFQSAQKPLTADNAPFVVGEVRYYVDTVDPPITGSLRRSVDVVRAYNDAVTGLANGQAVEAMVARLGMIGQSAIGAGTQVASLASAGAGAGIAALGTRLLTPLKALEPLASFALEQRSRAEFRDRLVKDHVHVDAVLAALIEATPDMYAVLVRPILRGRKTVAGTQPLTEEDVAALVDLRGALANWVILLEGSRTGLAAAVTAVNSQSVAGATTGIITTASELQEAARQARRNLAGL